MFVCFDNVMYSYGMLRPSAGACGGATLPVVKEVWWSGVPAVKVKVLSLGGSLWLAT